MFLMLPYMPHIMCYRLDIWLAMLHVLSDIATCFSLFGISYVTGRLAYRQSLFSYRTFLIAFSIYIGLCGATHFMSVITIWHPIYWIEGWIKAATAVMSLFVFFTLFHVRGALDNYISKIGRLIDDPRNK